MVHTHRKHRATFSSRQVIRNDGFQRRLAKLNPAFGDLAIDYSYLHEPRDVIRLNRVRGSAGNTDGASVTRRPMHDDNVAVRSQFINADV